MSAEIDAYVQHKKTGFETPFALWTDANDLDKKLDLDKLPTHSCLITRQEFKEYQHKMNIIISRS